MSIQISVCENIVNLLRNKEEGEVRYFYKNGDMTKALVCKLGIRDAAIAFLMYDAMHNSDFSIFRVAFPKFSLGDLDTFDTHTWYEWMGTYVDAQKNLGPILDNNHDSKFTNEKEFYGPVMVSNDALSPNSTFLYMNVHDFYY
jgi:hypothetical protein